MEGGGEASDGGGAVTNVIKSTKSDGSDAVNINIRRSNATKFAIHVSLESSVGSFKSVIAKNCEMPAEHQLLVYIGWILRDNRTLKSYGLEANHTVHLVSGILPAESNNTSNTITDGTIAGSSGSSISITNFSGSPEFEHVVHQLQLSIDDNLHDPCIRLTKILLYYLRNDEDDMANMIMFSPQWDEDVFSIPDISKLLNELLYASLVCEIIRGIYISRGGSDTPDVITLLNAKWITAKMLSNLLWNLRAKKWKFDPELDLMTGNGPFNLKLDEALLAKVQESLDAERRREKAVRESELDLMAGPLKLKLNKDAAFLAKIQEALLNAENRQEQGARDNAGEMDIDTDSSEVESQGSNVSVDPEQVYARQLLELEGLGFNDTQRNLEALAATGGNVPEAVQRLLLGDQ